ncbi:helix-turn-helix domain-containing protein [Nocardia sp. NPDC058519]|uniref:helix-turn-helix domain-containing protein n=1 Tax=Nocardia sp. NPDC058519 TaxID=3346535 RepID=UPI0036641D5C
MIRTSNLQSNRWRPSIKVATAVIGVLVSRAKPRVRARADGGPLADFGEYLAQRRHQLAMTQADLADLADVGVSTVRTLEAGAHTVTLQVTLRVLDALGLAMVGMPFARTSELPEDEVALRISDGGAR